MISDFDRSLGSRYLMQMAVLVVDANGCFITDWFTKKKNRYFRSH